MFSRKKELKVGYGSYWERMLGYNYSREFAIYNFLCGQELKKKELMKIPIDKKFKTYSAWECYVKSLYQNGPLSELGEFIKYLNFRKRIDSASSILTHNLLIPLMITLLSVWVMPALNDIPQNGVKIDNLGLSSLVMEIGVSLFIFLLQFGFVIGSIVGIVLMISKAVFNSKQVEVFYEDYMKIINDIIADKKNCIGSFKYKNDIKNPYNPL